MTSLLSSITKIIPKPLKQLLVNQRKLIIDPYTWLKPEPWTTLIGRTLRYRAAGLGLALTENEKRLLKHRDHHHEKRAFILGNGPSLNLCDLSLIKDDITFGVNSIFLNQERMGFFPTYYVVEDTFVAEDRAEQINQYTGPTKFFGNYLRYCLDDTDNTIWLNIGFRYSEYPGFPYFSRNAARILWVGGTVTYICLQLAYYMGFTEVYLIGFDHNYQIPADAIMTGRKNEILSQSDDPNHFHPGYFGKGYRWHDPRVDRMEKAYQRAKEYYETDGRFIYNATVDGKLEIFPRANYADLF